METCPPCSVGSLVYTVNERVSPSTSVTNAVRSSTTDASPSVAFDVLFAATGASFTLRTVTVQPPLVCPPAPSSATYVPVAVPYQSAGGVYDRVLLGLTATDPPSPDVTAALATVRVSPSGSLSLDSTANVIVASSLPDAVSATVTGAWLDALPIVPDASSNDAAPVTDRGAEKISTPVRTSPLLLPPYACTRSLV